MSIDTRYTQWFQCVRTALELTRYDVVEIMKLGGIIVSSSRADGWTRRRDDRSRATTMTEAEFDAFVHGLITWMRKYNR